MGTKFVGIKTISRNFRPGNVPPKLCLKLTSQYILDKLLGITMKQANAYLEYYLKSFCKGNNHNFYKVLKVSLNSREISDVIRQQQLRCSRETVDYLNERVLNLTEASN